MSDNINRIILWCIPRSVSTALVKCLSFVEGLQVVMEPYNAAYTVGPERKFESLNLANPIEKDLFEKYDLMNEEQQEVRGYDGSICTYGYVRDEILQTSYEGSKFLFCKDMAHHLDAKYHMLPAGFKHSFLIRHPAKVFLSWRKGFVRGIGESFNKQENGLLSLPTWLFPAGFGFKELYELTEYVEKELHQELVILDSDDLLADPPGILSAYCHTIGIPYKPELLSWEEAAEVTKKWIVQKGLLFSNSVGNEVFGRALQSTEFGSPEPVPALESLPADVQACVKASIGYYEKLYAKRIRPLTESGSQV